MIQQDNNRRQSPLSWATLLLPALLVLVAPLAACDDNRCQYNGDCATGFVCVSRQCIAPAGADHCPGGQEQCTEAAQCASMQCTDGCCTPPCTGPADCDVTETCVDGACQPVMITTGCQRNADCSAPTPFCLTATNTCAECRSTSDCGVNSHKTCSADTHTCIYPAGSCGADGDCTATPATPKCDTSQLLCVACLSADDCEVGEVCSQLQTCVPAPPEHCTVESDCVGNIHGLVHCDLDSNLCVRCVANNQCSSTQICRGHNCVPPSGCQSDNSCSGTKPYCNTDNGVCVACFDTAQCTGGAACVSNACTSCRTNDDCDTSSIGPACREDTHLCSQCNAAEDCRRPGATCNDNHQCVGGACLGDADCANSPSGSYCVEGACVGCRTAEQCTFGLSCFHNQCQVPTCDSDAECTTAITGPHCDVADHHCYKCATNAQCPRTLTCQNHNCALLACQTDGDCASNETAQHCDTQTKICVECAANTDCPPDLQCVAGSCGDHSTCGYGECGMTAHCVPIPVNNYTEWTERCVQPRTSGAGGGAPCATYADCLSGQCYHVAGNTTDGVCLDTCSATTPTGCATSVTTTCPANGVTVTLPGPDGVLNGTTTSTDDVVGVVGTCWPKTCTNDASCKATGFAAPGAVKANRVCSPTPNPMDPTAAPQFNCLPLTGYVQGGLPCFDNVDCQSNLCVEWTDSTMRTTGRCFGTCAADADCITIDHATASCRDVNVKLGSATLPLKSCIFRP